MKILFRCAISALVMAAAAPAGAQTPVPAQEQAPPRRPLDRLLQRRAQLGLSDAQVVRLREIGAGLERRNAPLRQRLAAERERWMAERRARLQSLPQEERRAEIRRMRDARQVPEPMQPLVREMRDNIAGAMREANQVLTPQQRRQVGQMLRAEARARGGALRGRPGQMRFRRGLRGRNAGDPGASAPGTRP